MTQILQPCEKQQKMVFQLPTNHLLMLHTKKALADLRNTDRSHHDDDDRIFQIDI